MSTIRFPPLPTIRDIIKLYNLRAIKQLSQNFLMDSRLTDKIVKSAGKLRGAEVCEVGPGPGSITRSILKRNPSKLVVIEKDKRFLPSLEMLSDASPCEMMVIRGDVLSFNMEKMFSEECLRSWVDEPPNIHLIGNLPFNISTPLIIRWLHAISERRSAWRYGRVKLTLTFQKEVAERMVAPVLSKQRCRLSVMCQNWCFVHHKFTIPGKAFVPPPDVDVGVVTFEPHVKPVIDLPFKMVEKVVRSLFSFRQKYCFKGLETLFPAPLRLVLTERLISEADVSPKMRPLMLSLGEIRRICFAYSRLTQENPSLLKYEYRQKKTLEEDFEDEPEEENDVVDSPDLISVKSGA